MHSGPPNLTPVDHKKIILFSVRIKGHFWKGAKCAGSVGHPMTKMLSASAGLRPPDPLTRGSAPGPRWGLRPPDPRYRLALPRSSFPGLKPPKHDILASPLFGTRRQSSSCATTQRCLCDSTCCCFHTIPTCDQNAGGDGQTDRRTHDDKAVVDRRLRPPVLPSGESL